MKGWRRCFGVVLGVALCGFLVFSTSAGAVEIVLEPANAQREVGGKVRVHFYADSASDLVSMGIQVSFDPLVLQVEAASKYEDVTSGWLLDADGDPGTTDDQYNDPPVEIDNGAGTVRMIGGHMAGPSTGGLSGKVLLGWIVFEAFGDGYSDITVARAKPAPFDNFVKVDKTVDEPTNLPGDLGVICVIDGACAGDVNNNGTVDMGDFAIIRAAMGTAFPAAGYDVRADINANGTVDMGDFAILRGQMGTGGCPSCPPPL